MTFQNSGNEESHTHFQRKEPGLLERIKNQNSISLSTQALKDSKQIEPAMPSSAHPNHHWRQRKNKEISDTQKFRKVISQAPFLDSILLEFVVQQIKQSR